MVLQFQYLHSELEAPPVESFDFAKKHSVKCLTVLLLHLGLFNDSVSVLKTSCLETPKSCLAIFVKAWKFIGILIPVFFHVLKRMLETKEGLEDSNNS